LFHKELEFVLVRPGRSPPLPYISQYTKFLLLKTIHFFKTVLIQKVKNGFRLNCEAVFFVRKNIFCANSFSCLNLSVLDLF